MAMSILLPAEGQFDRIERSLNHQFIDQALENLATDEVELFMPKFEHETDLSMSERLGLMGMPDLFTESVSDLSGIDGVHVPDSLYVSSVIHKAFISVGEKGTEAAAATGIVINVPTSAPPEATFTVHVDRPFIYFIRDRETGTILFMGRVLNPLGEPTNSSGEPVALSNEDTMAELVAGNNEFAFDLYRAIDEQEGNLFYSPYSISTALAMTYVGARGDTATQMADTLHYTLSPEQLHPTFQTLDTSLTVSNTGDNFQLSTANAVWGQIGYPFLTEYISTVNEHYGSGLFEVDFMNDEQREETRQTINQWVSDETGQKIPELFEEGILTQDTRLVLTNAIYFNAKWERPFLDGTSDRPFHLMDGIEVMVPTMSRRADMRYAKLEQCEILEVTYQGRRMSMFIILPAEGQLDTVENTITGESMTAALNHLQVHDIDLSIPKFEYEMGLPLNDTLKNMGATDLFRPGIANLSGIDGTNLLFLSHVVHKAFIRVDELGTEAAATTGGVAQPVSVPLDMRVNRPFIFAIRDNETGTFLFIGRVVDPR